MIRSGTEKKSRTRLRKQPSRLSQSELNLKWGNITKKTNVALLEFDIDDREQVQGISIKIQLTGMKSSYSRNLKVEQKQP